MRIPPHCLRNREREKGEEKEREGNKRDGKGQERDDKEEGRKGKGRKEERKRGWKGKGGEKREEGVRKDRKGKKRKRRDGKEEGKRREKERDGKRGNLENRWKLQAGGCTASYYTYPVTTHNFWLIHSFTYHLFLFCFTTLLIHNSLSLSLPAFHKSYPRSSTSSSRTAFTDLCLHRFFWANRFLFFNCSLIFCFHAVR